jgi:hypothetical protein
MDNTGKPIPYRLRQILAAKLIEAVKARAEVETLVATLRECYDLDSDAQIRIVADLQSDSPDGEFHFSESD